MIRNLTGETILGPSGSLMFHLNGFLFKKKSLETFQDRRLKGSVSTNKGEAVEGDQDACLPPQQVSSGWTFLSPSSQ